MPEAIGTALCRIDEIPDGAARGFTIGGGAGKLRIFAVRRGDAVHVYVNRCPHAGHPLNFKPHQFLSPDGSVILCTSHGAIFDLEAGSCIAGPCAGRGLQPLALRVEEGVVMLADDVPLVEPQADHDD